jgi:hypothetical protein
MKGQGLLLAIVTAVVIGVIVTGFLTMGTPGEARKVALDEKRVEDLRGLSNGIFYSWNKRHESPPGSLEAYMEGRPLLPDMSDPVSKIPYGYRNLGNGRFELCATFETAIAGDEGKFGSRWAHPAGRHCFQFDVRRSGDLDLDGP